MVAIRSPHGPAPVELGFEADYLPDSKALKVKSVVSKSPAQIAGMKLGDLIVAIEGKSVADEDYQSRILVSAQTG